MVVKIGLSSNKNSYAGAGAPFLYLFLSATSLLARMAKLTCPGWPDLRSDGVMS